MPFTPPSPGDPAASEEPYHFNGQIFTEQGYGSGVVTKEHTVLTAAHVLFDDTTLTHVKNVLWFHARHRGDYDLAPVRPRGVETQPRWRITGNSAHAGTLPTGQLELEIVVTGRLVAASEAANSPTPPP